MKSQKELSVNPKLFLLADNYCPFSTADGLKSWEKIVAEKAAKVSVDELRVPILGIQGTGKSSLINALLFKDIVLPVEADETTCIPTEIRYHDDNAIKVAVEFEKDGRTEILKSYKELDQYVDNNKNEANEKGVKRVVVYTKNELLKNGIVLVDLPGVGSLTQANEKQTMEYIRGTSYAVFLLRTVPPITKSEAAFLKLSLPQLIDAQFIQNRWNNERDEEVNQGKDANERNLNDILKQINSASKVDIHPVNIYEALVSALKDDDMMRRQSGIETLTTFIKNLGSNWKDKLIEMHIAGLITLNESVIERIEIQKNQSQLSIDDLRVQLEDAEMKLSEMISRNERRVQKIENMINDELDDLIHYIGKVSKDAKEDLRNDMRNVVLSNPDGVYLSRAFNDSQKEHSDTAVEKIMLKIDEVQRSLRTELDELEIRDMKGDPVKLSYFIKKQSFKAEKSAPALGASGGAILGGSLGSAFGPIGTIIGGILGGILGGFLGSGIKKASMGSRGSKTLQELEPKFSEFQDNITGSFGKASEELRGHLIGALNNLIKSQENELKLERERNSKRVAMTLDEKEAERNRINSDLENANSILNELKSSH